MYNKRAVIIIPTGAHQVSASISHVYSSGNWLEREIFDMFGMYFLHHPSLNRILTDYGFSAYPLRKDFPCEGYYSVIYSNYLYRIVYIFE
jgi:NADH-quinone oxidoreductase subunit C